jgi:uncharacterized membrane protein
MGRFIATVIVALVVIAAVLAVENVVYVRNTDTEAGILINKKELKEQTQEAVEKTKEAGGELLDNSRKALHDATVPKKPSHDERPPAAIEPSPPPHESQPEPASRGIRLLETHPERLV